MQRNILLAIAIIASAHLYAQDVLTIDSDTKSVTAGQYDRISDEWKLEAGKSYLIALPAVLDGYYFGSDAQRMKVTGLSKGTDGTYVVNITDMADLDDFQANEAYLITPTVTVDGITHITPGIKTKVTDTPSDKELMHVDGSKVVVGIQSVFMDDVDASPVYDIQGRRISDLYKGGTYIINGKKVIIK